MGHRFDQKPLSARSPPAETRVWRKVAALLGWRKVVLAWRDRILASPRFQRWAMGFWPTRWIARRRAQALFDLCAGFVYSQILYACIRLDLFTRLRDGPQSPETLAPQLDLSTAATLRLLEAARALGLVERRGADRYGLGTLGAALIGNPGVAAMVEHHGLLYADLADPVALLRGLPQSRALAQYWPYAGARQGAAETTVPHNPAALSGTAVGPYTALMGRSQAMIAGEILDAYRFERHQCLLDVGGGNGTFLTAVAHRAPRLQLMLFDLPAVAEQARSRLMQAGLGARTKVWGGDFHHDALPEGADVISLVRVLHDHDDAVALAILKAVRRALPADGTLILAEPMAGTRGAEAVGHAYFGFYLLAMGSGRPRDFADIAGLLRLAGFERIRSVATRNPMVTGLVVARP